MSIERLQRPAPGRHRGAARPAGGSGPVHGLVHEAVYVPGPRDLLDFAVPFLRQGLEGGERVAVAVAPELAERVRVAVDDPRLEVLPGSAPGVPDALTGLRDAAGSLPEQRLRLLGGVPYERDRGRRTEWMRFEALVNRELASSPLWLVCVQDEAGDDPELLDNAHRTHPYARRGPDEPIRPNPAYTDPRAVLAGLAAGQPDPLQAAPPDLVLATVEDLADLPEVRARLRQALSPGDSNFVTAVNEVVTNAVQHGRPPAHVELWTSPDRLVCTVRDLGPGLADPGTGYSARHLAYDKSPQFGLRVVRRLVDAMDHSRDENGFVVRLTGRR